MEATLGKSRPRVLSGLGNALIPGGIVVTLVGVIGDLAAHTLDPTAHAHEELFVLGSGNNPWHLVLFAGIVLTAMGGIRWASRLGTDWGHLLAAGMVLLLGAAMVEGGWSGWKAGQPASTTNASATRPVHASHGAGSQVASGGAAAVAGEGAEGASQLGHTHGQPGAVSAAQAVALRAQLAAAKAATAKYRDVSAAKATGYRQVTQFIPGLGLHLVNLNIPENVFDPSRPQILLYEPDGSGGLTLAGVAYRFVHTTDTPPEGFAGGSDVWHFHNNLCFLPGGSVTIAPTAAACAQRQGVFQAQTDWLLHAWVWKTNPNGVFTEFNPSVF